MHAIQGSSACREVLGSKPQVMIKFSAEWCGPCKAVAPLIEKLAPQFPSVFMAEVDIDRAQDVAAAYSITAVPSFVFFHGGVETSRVSGADVPGVTAALQALAASGPAFGKGGRRMNVQSAGAAPLAPASAAELRAARVRAFEGKLSGSQEPRQRTAAKTIPTHADEVRAAEARGASASGASIGSLPNLRELLARLLSFLALYFATLFSFDARAQAARFLPQ